MLVVTFLPPPSFISVLPDCDYIIAYLVKMSTPHHFAQEITENMENWKVLLLRIGLMKYAKWCGVKYFTFLYVYVNNVCSSKEGGEIMTKRRRQEYVQPVPGLLVVIPKKSLHFNDLRQAILDAGLDAPRITESFCMVNVPHGEEVRYAKRINKLSFVESVQRHFHFDPPI